MLLGRVMPRVSRSRVAKQVLRTLSAAVLGVMLVVSWRIGLRLVVDAPSALIAIAALALLRTTRVGPVALIPVGAAVGWLLHLLPA
jgi:chromate transport protein ChrA